MSFYWSIIPIISLFWIAFPIANKPDEWIKRVILRLLYRKMQTFRETFTCSSHGERRYLSTKSERNSFGMRSCNGCVQMECVCIKCCLYLSCLLKSMAVKQKHTLRENWFSSQFTVRKMKKMYIYVCRSI